MTEVDPGVFRLAVPTAVSGVHRVLVRAAGADLAGLAFTREELRTIAVWPRGDDPAPPIDRPGAGIDRGPFDWCRLLACWLKNRGVTRVLRAHEIDADELLECVHEACHRR